ncbi:helix-turn-helix domain-containing protein [Bacteroidota bacterium]
MLSYNFNRIFKARAVEKPFTYLRNAGFSDKFATKIKNNKIARINLREIERLCILLRCTPNDFFEWTPDKDNQIDSEHPIYKIKKSDKVVDITKTLNSVPLDQLDEIEEMIKNKIMNSETT